MTESYLYVSQPCSSGCSNPWTALGGAMLNANGQNSGTNVASASMATDGSGNIMAVWAEWKDDQAGGNRWKMLNTPAIYARRWNGSAWSSVICGGSLSQSTSNWSYTPSVFYFSGLWYFAWTERASNGWPVVYVKSFNGSTCSLVGSGALNASGTGIDYHPVLATDGTSLFVSFEEQSARGQHNLGYIKKWNGSVWTTLAGPIAADTTNGSIEGLSISAAPGAVTSAWSEMKYGNLRQVYAQQNNLLYCTINTSSLPGGTIGASYSQTIATSQCASPTFSVSAGSLPGGLTLGSTGTISGYPTTAGTSAITVSVTDANGNPTQALSITISTPSLSQPVTVQELIFSGALTTGITRTNEPVTFGMPVPDSAGLTNTNVLGMAGVSAAQFTSEATWPNGNLKWVKVRAIVPSVGAGSTATITFTNSGGGNFGGSDLATDAHDCTGAGNANFICVNTGTAIFQIKKSNFNFLDQVKIGATTFIASGTSSGLAIRGPNASATYPGNVTCNPTSGGTACTTLYTTANDGTHSTVTVEENGPAMAVLKWSADLNDGSGHVYMHTMGRMYFAANKSYVKYTAILQDASYDACSPSCGFASATKGHQGFEVRVHPALSGTLTYNIAAPTCSGGLCSGTMTAGNSGNYAYIYQAESNTLKPSAWCQVSTGAACFPFTSLSGYAVLNNSGVQATGTASQIPAGWAALSDAANNTILIGSDQFAGYGNQALEFCNGGSDVRIGIWAEENNTTSTSALASCGMAAANPTPYYQPWPQWDIHSGYLDFSAGATLGASDFFNLQYALGGRPTASWYNTAAVLPYPMLDPTEESTYYTNLRNVASPTVPALSPSDSVLATTATAADQMCADNWVCVYRVLNWATPGGNNQMEFHYSNLMDWVRRGFSGAYVNAANYYQWVAGNAAPMDDTTYRWDSYAVREEYYDLPEAATFGATANSAYPPQAGALSNRGDATWMEADAEHQNAQGMDSYYLMSGDETIKDGIEHGLKEYFLVSTSANNFTTVSAAEWNDRAAGQALMWIARLALFENSIGNTVDATTLRTNAETMIVNRLLPDFCSYSGYPAGCTPDTQNNNGNGTLQVGTSKLRGVSNVFRDTSVTIDAANCPTIPNGVRTAKPFMTSRKIEGMYEFYKAEQVLNPSWTYLNTLWDYAYGSAQWAVNEMGVDNGLCTSGSCQWTGNGFRYAMAIDYANACNASGSSVATDNFLEREFT